MRWLTAGCLPAVRPGQTQSRESPLTPSSSTPQLSSTPYCNGGNCLSTRGPLIRGTELCSVLDVGHAESLNAASFSHQFHETHFNTDTALMLDNCVFGYSRFKYQIKIEYLVLTNKCRVNLLNQRSILLQMWSQHKIRMKKPQCILRSSSNCSQNVKA